MPVYNVKTSDPIRARDHNSLVEEIVRLGGRRGSAEENVRNVGVSTTHSVKSPLADEAVAVLLLNLEGVLIEKMAIVELSMEKDKIGGFRLPTQPSMRTLAVTQSLTGANDWGWVYWGGGAPAVYDPSTIPWRQLSPYSFSNELRKGDRLTVRRGESYLIYCEGGQFEVVGTCSTEEEAELLDDTYWPAGAKVVYVEWRGQRGQPLKVRALNNSLYQTAYCLEWTDAWTLSEPTPGKVHIGKTP
jgi:hypothetical protein